MRCGSRHGTGLAPDRELLPGGAARGTPGHDPSNPYPRLRSFCPSCHGRYDFRSGERRGFLALAMLKHRLLLQQQQRGAMG
jgi:hypothetical protein